MEGQFRSQLGFTGTPLRLIWRGKREREVARGQQSNRATKV
jgi:GTP-binding protein